MRKRRRRRSGFVWVRWGDQYGLAAQPHGDALLSRIERTRRVDTAGDFGAEHGLEKPGCRIRVSAAQMNVIVPVDRRLAMRNYGQISRELLGVRKRERDSEMLSRCVGRILPRRIRAVGLPRSPMFLPCRRLRTSRSALCVHCAVPLPVRTHLPELRATA